MRKSFRFVGILLAVIVAVPVGAVVWHFWQWGARLPSAADLATMTSDSSALCRQDGGRPTASLRDIPKTLIDAFVAAEDKDFWIRSPSNPFLDLVKVTIFHMPPQPQGITLWLAREVTSCSRAKQEIRGMKGWHESFAIMTYRIDRALPKDRILEIFLNNIWLGRGTSGVVGTAYGYFGKPLNQLSLSESAFLAALPKRPNEFDRQPSTAVTQRNVILDRMVAHGDISVAEAEFAKVESLEFVAQRSP
ncbi:MAG: hypothetical protein F8N39_11760 [Clostridiaceae bacterium]|nr:hypothetical protein [Clostridiaceae bacterium]